MKRLIRNRNTGFYLSNQGGWTDDWQQAKQFESFDCVWEEKKNHQLAEIDLVLMFGDAPSAQYDIILPLSDPAAAEPSPDSAAFASGRKKSR